MSQTVTLGGDRLGSGKKQTVELHNYEMTSFNLEQDFKSTIAPGILYPFLRAVATNHGTFDIDLDTFVRTLPTVGPLFGSFKMQLDLFSVPFRLYQGLLHNNPVTLGMKMNQVYLPKLRFRTRDGAGAVRVAGSTDDDYQVSTSALLKYDGISGAGKKANWDVIGDVERKFQCIPELAYYDIFKCYYANKQEELAYVITPGTPTKTPQNITTWSKFYKNGSSELTQDGKGKDRGYNMLWYENNAYGEDVYFDSVEYRGSNLSTKYTEIEFWVDRSGTATKLNLGTFKTLDQLETAEALECTIENNILKITSIDWDSIVDDYGNEGDTPLYAQLTFKEIDNLYTASIELTPFALANIDDMRNALLSANTIGKEFIIGGGEYDDWGAESGTDHTGLPYSALFKVTNEGISWNAFVQNGLVVKTYQSDLFNNWLDTEYIDGENGISAISSVAVVNNKFTMDSLNLAEKIYEYLNRVLVSGGTYEDWQEATYGQGAVRKAETPMYIGGMSTEIMFEEVVATTEASGNSEQVLGSIAGKGSMARDKNGNTLKKGGNNIHVKCDEPSYIIGILSITPRICYSQGNDWDRTELDTMDDLHKPALDGIGFQDLIVEQMAWWNTRLEDGAIVHRDSAGKQIAWINYQTAVDKCFGEFAKTEKGLGFMVLNRNYEHGELAGDVKDITTYIDPVKFNYAFTQTDLSAQNFWVQAHSFVIARRKMAGKQIPNL